MGHPWPEVGVPQATAPHPSELPVLEALRATALRRSPTPAGPLLKAHARLGATWRQVGPGSPLPVSESRFRVTGSRAQPGSQGSGQSLFGFSWPREAPAMQWGRAASGPVSQRTPRPASPHPEASPGHPGPSYLALTVGLKLGQFQGNLGILAACRNKSKVDLAGVAKRAESRCWGRRLGG